MRSLERHFQSNSHNLRKDQNNILFKCKCGKSFTQMAGLSRHKKSCFYQSTTEQIEEEEPIYDNPNLVCKHCKKEFKHRSGLWKHQKNNVCLKNTEKFAYQNSNENKYIDNLLKENADLKDIMVKTHNSMIDTQNKMMGIIEKGHTTTHNSFNLNIFLNDKCKGAMNLREFVENLKLKISDLENMGEIGFVNGLSKIITNSLNNLHITERPIHCTDAKREILYIKDENKWNKDDNDHDNIRKFIKKVAIKNTKLLNDIKIKYPNYNKSQSGDSDKYNKIIVESMGGKGDNELEKENKIIKNISKGITLDKENLN
jgi:hypothetical protein